MKQVAAILTILLCVPLEFYFIQSIQLYIGYPSLKEFGMSLSKITAFETPFIIKFIICLTLFAACFILLIKRRYIPCTVVASLVLLIYAGMSIFAVR